MAPQVSSARCHEEEGEAPAHLVVVVRVLEQVVAGRNGEDAAADGLLGVVGRKDVVCMEGGAGSARVAEVEKEGAGRELCSPMAAVAVKVVSLCWWTASLASSRPGMLVERGGVEVGSARRRRSRRARAGGVRE